LARGVPRVRPRRRSQPPHRRGRLGLQPTGRGSVEVTIPRSSLPQGLDGVRVHRSIRVEVATAGTLPVTTIGRTLLDLAPTFSLRALEGLINQAELLRLYDGCKIGALLAAHPQRPGAPKLRSLLARLRDVGTQRARSKLEVRFLELCDAHDLPSPRANVVINGHEVDFHWRGTRLIVETDSYKHHRMPADREADAAKRLELEGAGYRVIPLTWRQVTETPAATAASLRRLLAQAA
jgi:very-short-patch-repair endonuclease